MLRRANFVGRISDSIAAFRFIAVERTRFSADAIGCGQAVLERVRVLLIFLLSRDSGHHSVSRQNLGIDTQISLVGGPGHGEVAGTFVHPAIEIVGLG